MTALKGAKTENNLDIYKKKQGRVEDQSGRNRKTDQGTLERCLKNGR